MTGKNPFEGQPKAFQRAVFPDGFQSILGAGRGVTASRGSKGRNATLVEPDRKKQQKNEKTAYVQEKIRHGREVR